MLSKAIQEKVITTISKVPTITKAGIAITNIANLANEDNSTKRDILTLAKILLYSKFVEGTVGKRQEKRKEKIDSLFKQAIQ